MLTVMLVDDNPRDLECLEAFVPWSEVGMEVTSSHHTPFSAIEALHRHPVDILITNIDMPHMTGLTLAAKARIKHPYLKIIFLSGSKDFDYVQQALALKAEGYLLKPVDGPHMLQLLGQVGLQIMKERRLQRKSSAFGALLPYVKNGLFLQWLQGELDPVDSPSLLVWLESMPVHSKAAVAVFEMDDAYRHKVESTEFPCAKGLEENRLLQWRSAIVSAIESVGLGIACKTSVHRIAVIIEDIGKMNVSETMRHVLLQWNRKLPYPSTVGLGGQVDRWEEIPRSYQEAKQAVEGKMFLGKGQVILYEQLKGISSEAASDWSTILLSVNDAIAQTNGPLLDLTLDHLQSYWQSLPNRRAITQSVLQFITHLQKLMTTPQETAFLWDMTDPDSLQYFDTVVDITNWLRKWLRDVLLSSTAGRLHKNIALIQLVKDYVYQNLSGQISLREVAGEFGFTPNHLGRLFKEVTGHNFSEFLVRARVEMAKTLLGNPLLKIYEIADMTGYRNIYYFSRQFKENVGITPNEYRKCQGEPYSQKVR